MPSLQYTVDDIVSQVRSQIDEDNQDTVSDSRDLLPAINRAQDYAVNILARHYQDPYLKYATVQTIAGQNEYDIPEDAFEDRLQKVEISINSAQFEVNRISFRNVSVYESRLQLNIPYYYLLVGRKIRLIPAPTGIYPLRIWYMREPEHLVKTQGRITTVNTGSGYVLVDSIGDDLTTESDQLASYVNIVDGQTGEIKTTLQINNISDTRVTFKSSPIRTSVLNRTVATSLSSTVAVDDYVCLVQGTCVPYFNKPISNFLVQYAVSEMRRKLGVGSETEEQILAKFEDQVRKSWVMREEQLRVKKRSKNWDLPFRRWYFTQRS